MKVSAQTVGSMGKVLVSGGKALYVLTPSGTGCDTACLSIWPALTVHTGSKATAGSGVTKSKLGVTTDAKGARQVTYGGKPCTSSSETRRAPPGATSRTNGASGRPWSSRSRRRARADPHDVQLGRFVGRWRRCELLMPLPVTGAGRRGRPW